MERRKESRIKPSELISVTVLGEGQLCMEGGIIDVSRRGIGLRLPAPVPPGSPIKIEAGDELILGEVTYCSPGNGAYLTGLVVKHRLDGLAGLHRLNRVLLGAPQEVSQDETLTLIMKG